MSKSFFKNPHMQAALLEAKAAFMQGEIPVGAVVVNNQTQEIIATSHNLVEQRNNPTLHAEMLAIKQACLTLGTKNLSGYTIYVTLEPCAMCAAAIAFARFDQLFYAAEDEKQGAIEHGVRFFTNPSCFHQPQIFSGIEEAAAKELMKDFFTQLRTQKC